MKKLLYVCSEACPFASSGGLGDVMGSLPSAVADLSSDIDVRVVMPLYASVGAEFRRDMRFVCSFNVPLAWRNQYCGVFEYKKQNTVYYFLDNEYYFKRDMLYGSFDDAERFAFFCKAVMEMFAHIKWAPDILHANDWQSALTVIYHKLCGYYPSMRTVYTIHNIEYQGRYGRELLGDVFDIPAQSEPTLRLDGDINLTKGAIVLCDKLTTVSPNYANELHYRYFAHGLDGVIRDNDRKFCGILNGIPDTVGSIGSGAISQKAKRKTELQKRSGLTVDESIPLLCCISRLAPHKGFDLVTRVMDEIISLGVQFIVLGNGEYEYEAYFRGLAMRHSGTVSANIRFDRELSNDIYAAADFLLMPSRSEPCGIAQMIACANATIPIVRLTGGLCDTIKAFDPVTLEGNGITFGSYNAHDMLDAVKRGLDLYRQKDKFDALRRNAASSDFGWERSAKQYIELYNDLI